ncbi:nuclear transport factor 2 family protein [Nocardia sp. NPDC058666]|uniref:nuclear transport factor 2 family protein n=1 Tax=Nocardia sp. NPDC058666 TaxID=3346587 RepID=UPI0036652DE6
MSEITERAARRLLIDYTRDIALSDEDPADIVDRAMTEDVSWRSNGIDLDRAKLIAHATPSRKNATAVHVHIHDLLVDGDRFAARCRMEAEHRKLGHMVIEWIMLGTVAADGRVRRIHQLHSTPKSG